MDNDITNSLRLGVPASSLVAPQRSDRQMVVVENKLEELNLSSDDDDAAGSSQGKAEVLRQLEEELEGAKASRKLLNELLSKSQEEAIAKAVESQNGSITVELRCSELGLPSWEHQRDS